MTKKNRKTLCLLATNKYGNFPPANTYQVYWEGKCILISFKQGKMKSGFYCKTIDLLRSLNSCFSLEFRKFC